MDVKHDTSAGDKERDGRSLLIEGATVNDAGIYVCIAQNNAGTAIRQIRLQVQGLLTLLKLSFL